MKTLYDTDNYVKGKRVRRLRDVTPGKLYILVDNQFDQEFMIRIHNLESWTGIDYSTDYYIIDALKYRLNGFEYHLWDYEISKKIGRRELYEAEEPDFTCKQCKSHDVPMPITATRFYRGKERVGRSVGRSCNYYRCAHCGTINRHVWITGYEFIWARRTVGYHNEYP